MRVSEEKLPPIPKSWTIKTLSELAVGGISNGFFKKPELIGSGYRLVNVLDLYQDFGIDLNSVERVNATEKEYRKYAVQPGDCFFTRSSLNLAGIAHCNIIRQLSEPALFECHLMRVRPDQTQVIPEFLALWCRSSWAQKFLMNRAKQVTMTTIAQPDIAPLPVVLPTKNEQAQVVAAHDEIDSLIARSSALIAKLKQMKAGLLHDLLTRGLDETGQLRDPVRHPELFKESELGQIPREWQILRLGELANLITSGSRWWAAYYSEHGAIFLRIGNLTRENINLRLNDLVYVNPPVGSEGARTRVQPGDILISITADLGIIGVIPKSFSEAYVNQHIALIRLNQSKATPHWVGNYLAGEVGQKVFYQLNDSGAKAGLNLSTIESLLIAIPPIQEQEKISSLIIQNGNSIRIEETYLEKLKLQKQGLMDDLLTGRVRIS